MSIKMGARVALLCLLSVAISACNALAPVEDDEPTFSGAPVVQIVAPATGDTYQATVGVPILLRVSNAGADIARVTIEVDGQIVGEQLEPNVDGAASFTVRSGWTASSGGQHTITARVARLDGSTGQATPVTINIAGDQPTAVPVQAQPTTVPQQVTPQQPAGQTQPTQQTMPDPQPTTQATATNTVVPTATNISAPTNTPTPDVPTVTVNRGANVRGGPSTLFDVVGSLRAGDTATLFSRSLDGRWFKIQYYNTEAWIFADLVDFAGDLAAIPSEAGPPLPPTATPVPPTATPTSPPNIDLVIAGEVTNPSPFVCNEASSIRVTVQNNGTERSPGGFVRVIDLYNGTPQQTTNGALPALDPGATATVEMFLTVSTYIDELHVQRIVVDPDNQIAESNENNNTLENQYVLSPGSC
jgi:hypothetical protein